MPFQFEANLREPHLRHFVIPQLSPDDYQYFREIENRQPKHIRDILAHMLSTIPESDIHIFPASETYFTFWIKKATRRNAANCGHNFGQLHRDLRHETSWAIIAARMLSIQQYLSTGNYVELSPQYLLDFVNFPRAVEEKRGLDCCKTGNVAKAIAFACNTGIPSASQCKYKGCNDEVELCRAPLLSVRGDMGSLKFEEALISINYVPVAAKLHLFQTTNEFDQNEIYRGPKDDTFDYYGLHDVMILETNVMNDELVAVVDLPCVKVFRLNVSLDVMLMQAPQRNCKRHKGLDMPSRLLVDFCAFGSSKKVSQFEVGSSSK